MRNIPEQKDWELERVCSRSVFTIMVNILDTIAFCRTEYSEVYNE